MYSTPEKRPSNKKFVTPSYAPISKRYEEETLQERYCNAARQNSRVVSCFEAEYNPKTKTVFAQEKDQMAEEENDYPGNYREGRDKSKITYGLLGEKFEDEGVQKNRKAFGMVNDVRLNKMALDDDLN